MSKNYSGEKIKRNDMNKKTFILILVILVVISVLCVIIKISGSDYESTKNDAIKLFNDNRDHFTEIKDYLCYLNKSSLITESTDISDLMTITISDGQTDFHTISMNVFTADINNGNLSNQANRNISAVIEDEFTEVSLKKLFEAGVQRIEAEYSRYGNKTIFFEFKSPDYGNETVSVAWYAQSVPQSREKMLSPIEDNWYYCNIIYE